MHAVATATKMTSPSPAGREKTWDRATQTAPIVNPIIAALASSLKFSVPPIIFCLPPPDGLTVEQLCALHEFFHAVLVAGYRLYQVVPIDKAADIIRDKFSGMVGVDARGGSRV
jgi:hypothetical protein